MRARYVFTKYNAAVSAFDFYFRWGGKRWHFINFLIGDLKTTNIQCSSVSRIYTLKTIIFLCTLWPNFLSWPDTNFKLKIITHFKYKFHCIRNCRSKEIIRINTAQTLAILTHEKKSISRFLWPWNFPKIQYNIICAYLQSFTILMNFWVQIWNSELIRIGFLVYVKKIL